MIANTTRMWRKKFTFQVTKTTSNTICQRPCQHRADSLERRAEAIIHHRKKIFNFFSVGACTC